MVNRAGHGLTTCARGLGDAIAAALVWGMALIVTAGFAWIVGDLLYKGLGAIDWAFLFQAPQEAGRAGGIGPILISTGLILLVCLAVALPLALGTAILLAEYASGRGWFGRFVRRSLDVLAGVPSIVFGLFGNALFVLYLGMGYSILAGGLTLACMALPLMIRTAEQGLRAVPDEQRLGAAALGMSRVRMLVSVLLPSAAPAIGVGLVLGIGRALAETAALLFTAGYVDRVPGSLLDSGRALSIHIYDLAMNVPGGETHAYGTAVVLVSLLLLINGGCALATQRVFAKGL
jgi:phosphate transport system permease protein